MAWTQRALVAGIAGLGALIVVGRVKSGGHSGRAGQIKDAVYATPIPVYPGAKLKDVGGGNYYDEIGGPVTFTSKSWFYEIKDPVATVADYYAKHLPEGAHPAEAENGAISYEWIPPGAAEGELVSVTVRDGELQIGETVKAGKAGAATVEAAR